VLVANNLLGLRILIIPKECGALAKDFADQKAFRMLKVWKNT
jgi:hypothetical protein